MKKSTLVMILCLVLAVAMGVGSTMAYLQDTDEDVNVMTLGSVYITQNEQERDADGNLVPFTQEKPVYPAVGPIEWADAGKGVVVNGIEYKVFTDKLQNVVDKIVTVTNTGKSDAYIRTIIAIEAPNYDPNDLIHINYNGTDVATSAPVCFTRDGVDYVCFCFTYADALAPQETSAPSLVQLFLDSKATNADVEKFGDTWEVLVLSQAVQTQGFTDAETALNTAFEEVNAENVTKWFGADFGKNIGSPGKDWINNNPPAEFTGDPAELYKLLSGASDAGSGNVTIELTESYDMTGYDWTPVYVDGYHGADVVTVNGNGNYIKGLNAPLYSGGFAGGSGIVINDLTIMNSDIVSTNKTGSAAFIEYIDSMQTIVLDNCHLLNSKVTGGDESRTGGLVGYTSGYNNVNDGPVKTYVDIRNCSVIDCEITCNGSVGAIYGHAGANAWTYSTIENCTVKNCKLISTDDGGWRVGVVVGTANVGEMTIDNITESGNTLTQTGKTAPDGQSNLFGRFVPGSTGKLVIDGVKIN